MDVQEEIQQTVSVTVLYKRHSEDHIQNIRFISTKEKKMRISIWIEPQNPQDDLSRENEDNV